MNKNKSQKRKVISFIILGLLSLVLFFIAVVEVKKKYFYPEAVSDSVPYLHEALKQHNYKEN